VISDVMMPVMNGIELTRRIKNNLNTCHIPVIMLTARNTEESQYEGIEGGADVYMTKPFKSELLLLWIRKIIENRNKIRQYYKENSIEVVTSDSDLNKIDKKFIQSIISKVKYRLPEDTAVDELSEDMGLSRVHFYRKVKALTGFTATEFIRVIKLQHAAKLLTEDNLNVSEACFRSGFSNPSYFTKCFKEYYSVSPKEFINKKGHI